MGTQADALSLLRGQEQDVRQLMWLFFQRLRGRLSTFYYIVRHPPCDELIKSDFLSDQ